MFNPFPTENPHLDASIDLALKELYNHDPTSDEYAKITKQLADLYALKNKTVDPNALLAVLANAFIVARVVKFEKTGVITTKAMSFLSKIH